MTFDRNDRTYYVSDERLRAFRCLPIEDRLRWVEELALFLRQAREARHEKALPAQAEANKPCADQQD